MRIRPICAAFAAAIGFAAAGLLSASGAAAQELLDAGWWVVVANVPQDATPGDATRDRDAVIAKLKPCGFTPFNDVSGKFSGFRPGFTVFVLGAFPTRNAAEHVRAAVSACAPTAYVKAAKYAGE